MTLAELKAKADVLIDEFRNARTQEAPIPMLHLHILSDSKWAELKERRIMELADLKIKADELGIKYPKNITAKKLAAKIDDVQAPADEETPIPVPEPVAEGDDTQIPAEAPAISAPEDAEPAPEAPATPEDWVSVRITKKGDGRVSNGMGGNYAWKDEPKLPPVSAEALEVKGWAEIG